MATAAIPATFAAFVEERNRVVAESHAAELRALPPEVVHRELVDRAASTGDPDLERLALEYLPLTFSRRHGDPSRPWNRFSIQVRDRGRHARRFVTKATGETSSRTGRRCA